MTVSQFFLLKLLVEKIILFLMIFFNFLKLFSIVDCVWLGLVFFCIKLELELIFLDKRFLTLILLHKQLILILLILLFSL